MEKLGTTNKSLRIAPEPQEDTTKGTEFHLGVQENQGPILAYELHGSRLYCQKTVPNSDDTCYSLELDICLGDLFKHYFTVRCLSAPSSWRFPLAFPLALFSSINFLPMLVFKDKMSFMLYMDFTF